MSVKINFDNLNTPTIILNEKQAKKNLQMMVDKAAVTNIRFRPHFKTHQSAYIGEWFKDAGISEITVSSVTMADYFSSNGWKDVLIAFPVNMREIERICLLAKRIHLGLLVDMEESIKGLGEAVKNEIDIWIKIDTGMRRAGVWWENEYEIRKLIALIEQYPYLKLRGLLTHAGQTYHTSSRAEILDLYQESNYRMSQLRDHLLEKNNYDLELSVGDTPGCCLSDDLGRVDEIRPGNFLFFDANMMQLGVCHQDEIAVCVACPIVSVFPRRKEIVIYGGAIHLSKETIESSNSPVYGYAVFSPDSSSWNINRTNYVRSLSQEHGVVRLCEEDFKKAKIGDLIYIVPVHSCLVVDALGEYLTLDGNVIWTRVR